MFDVSVIVPAYNDDRINICAIKLNCLPDNYEWIVASEKCKGKAVVEAVRRARGKVIVTCDTDFKQQLFIPEYVERFELSNTDVLVGKRIFQDKPFSRRVSSKLYNFFKQVLFGALPDTQSGFKIFRKETLLNLEPFVTKEFAWDTEFVAKAKDAGLKIVETPVFERYSKGTFKLRNGFKMGYDLTKIWLHNRWNLLLFFVSLTYLIGLILASSLTSIPIGTDVHFHYDVARIYSVGEFGMFSQTVLELNHFPYPPLFHLLLVPSVWLHLEYLFAKSLQIFLPFLIYVSTILFVRYYSNQKTQFITALLLLSTMGFIDGTIQARPQGLAMILIPIMLFTFIQRRDNKFVLSSGLLAYIHGVAGLANMWTLTFYGFVRKNWNRTFTKLAIVLAPIVIITLIYLGGAFGKWGSTFDTYQEYLIFTKPQEMIPYYSGMCLIGWVFLGYNLLRWKSIGEVERTLSLSIVGLMVMIPFWADRFLQYATITLACISAFGLAKHKRAQQIVLPLVALMYVLVMANLYWTTFTNNWWLYPP